MRKTVFDVDDIYEVRRQRETEYAAAMTSESAVSLLQRRADAQWEEITRLRVMRNAYHKCPNNLLFQPDYLPLMRAKEVDGCDGSDA